MHLLSTLSNVYSTGKRIACNVVTPLMAAGRWATAPLTNMEGLELNKLAAAILVAGIIAMVAGKAAEILYSGEEGHGAEKKRGYVVAGAVEEGAPAAEEKPVDIALFLAKADKAKGESLAKACLTCHDFSKGGPNKVGPNLWGIVGSKHGHKEDFAYSKAISSIQGPWTYQAISEFITKPSKYAPGTKMGYAGMKDPQQRADVLAYLQTVSDSPVAFPAPSAAAAEEKPTTPGDAEKAAAGQAGATKEGTKDAAHPEQSGGLTETRSGHQSGAQTAKKPTDAVKENAQKGIPETEGVGPSKAGSEPTVGQTRPQSAPAGSTGSGAPKSENASGTVNAEAAKDAAEPATNGVPAANGEGEAGKRSSNPATPSTDAGSKSAPAANGKTQLPASSNAPDAGEQGNVNTTKQTGSSTGQLRQDVKEEGRKVPQAE